MAIGSGPFVKPSVLVTGANGYTGSFLCRYLARKGVPTRGMYWPPDGEPDFSCENLELVPGDLTDRESLRRALDGVRVVHNVAALYRATNVPKKMYWDANVEGVRNIVELAAEAGVERFVHCSTIGVHGHVENPPADENAPIKPDDYYQLTKWEGEKIARELGPRLGLKLSVIRPAAIYGPRERRFLKLTQLIARGRFVMFGDGEVKYHFTHIDDLCRAFELCASRDEAVGQVYIIADEYALTLNQIVRIIAEALGVEPPRRRLPYGLLYATAVVCEAVCTPLRIRPPVFRRRAAWFRSCRWFDISKAKRELGFSPQVRPEDGLPQMVQSYRQAGWIS